jgi:hypothetical protein
MFIHKVGKRSVALAAIADDSGRLVIACSETEVFKCGDNAIVLCGIDVVDCLAERVKDLI